MRTIVISDIHGCYNELKDLISSLEKEGKYNKNTDRLIFLGDYIDRGDNSRLVVRFIRELQRKNDNVIALMGNHEKMLLDYQNGIDASWEFNGSYQTMDSYQGFEEQFDSDVRWMERLPLYYEDDFFVYVHAGIDVNKPLKEQSKNTLLWVREAFIYSFKKYHKRVVFGHTPTLSFDNSTEPFYTLTDNIGIDTGCVFGGALTALIIEDSEVKGFYQVYKEVEEDEEEYENIII